MLDVVSISSDGGVEKVADVAVGSLKLDGSRFGTLAVANRNQSTRGGITTELIDTGLGVARLMVLNMIVGDVSSQLVV